MKQFITGSELCATPIAAINVNLGFEPRYVRVYNPNTGAEIEWFAENPTVTRKKKPGASVLLSKGRVTMGTSAKDKIKTSEFTVQIAGVKKVVAAAETSKTDEDIPAGKWGLYGIQVGVDGTIDAAPNGAGNTTGYATEAAAIAGIESLSSGHVLVGYATVQASTSSDYVGDAAFDDSSVKEVNFYDATPGELISTNGITLIEVGDSSEIYAGFTIGADADIQVAGDTIYWEASR